MELEAVVLERDAIFGPRQADSGDEPTSVADHVLRDRAWDSARDEHETAAGFTRRLGATVGQPGRLKKALPVGLGFAFPGVLLQFLRSHETMSYELVEVRDRVGQRAMPNKIPAGTGRGGHL
ncbi:hypothetical protein AB0H43_07255 [Hamadaea sp. NPDC050747]|uniref:hypothetical protein n=1 Tax=Hamadaea sp. NPDC050747 TaxID=3155789 RepID=UPI0033E7A923